MRRQTGAQEVEQVTDYELAVSHFLPDVWTPGRVCTGQIGTSCPVKYGEAPAWEWDDYYCYFYHRQHNIPCPPPNREIAGRLLEAVIPQDGVCIIPPYSTHKTWIVYKYNDRGEATTLSDAIIAYAAARARKGLGNADPR